MSLLDLRALRLRFRANYVGLGTNLIPKKLGLIPHLISKQFALSPRHFRPAVGGKQVVRREFLTAPHHSRDCQSLLSVCRHPAQCRSSEFGNPMQRHKASMPVFAVERKRKYSQGNPVSGFVRVHGVLTVWTLDEQYKERLTEQSVLLRDATSFCRDGACPVSLRGGRCGNPRL